MPNVQAVLKRQRSIRGLMVAWVASWVALLALAGCGGADDAGRGAGTRVSVAEGGAMSGKGMNEKALATVLAEGAALNAQALAEARDKAGFAAQTKALAAVPVYRFYNRLTGAHFYTVSAEERDRVRASLANMVYEGAAFEASLQPAAGLSPVHRFYNRQTGVHFYTISESEQAHVQANLPQFVYEGVAYYASLVPGAGWRPLSRFFLANKGFHFYSINPSEVAFLPQYVAEGVGYYVVGDAPAPTEYVRSYGQCARADLGVGAALNGCVPFPADNAWNADVSALPRDPNSDALIASIGLDRGLHPDFGSGTYNGAPIGIPYVVVSGAQPRVNILWTAYGDESDPGPYP
ncbi:MAG: hypothetical protein R3E56_18185, partial [Burkholderiaceae bacterium]